MWNTYISHSLTDSQTHSLVHNIPDAPTKRYFLQKRNSKMGLIRKDWSRLVKLKVVNNLFMHTFHCSFNSNYHNYNTRSKRNIRKSSAHRRWGHWITSNFAADAWNALPLSLRDVPTLSQFKRGIKKALF